MGFFQLQPLIPTYAAFSWDPTDEAWERVAFNMPPVVLSGPHIMMTTFLCLATEVRKPNGLVAKVTIAYSY